MADTFVDGQCIKAKLESPDLSPDGQYFVYYVNTQTGKERSVYRAVSRWPWLKALAFWSDSCWIGGPGPGLFVNGSDQMWASDRVPAEWDHLGIQSTPDLPSDWQGFVKAGLLSIQLQRDGWKPSTPWEECEPEEADGVAEWMPHYPVHRIIFRKPLPDNKWHLQMTHWCGINKDENRGISFETFAMVSPAGSVEKCEGWCSADFDTIHGRVVWTNDNVLYAAKVGLNGLKEPSILHDARRVRFHARQAPY